ncbi:MAG TPA: phage minor head protein [Ignavibacteriaceae bacterium]|nr:phage minor head protein [Ignavibacteriaceae bacterium]
MNADQIKFLLNLPPEQIVNWYRSKGLQITWSWSDLWQDAHSTYFTVAKVMRLDILQSLKDEVNKIFNSGITFEQFKKNLEPVLKRLGWWGKVKASDVPGFDPSSGIDPNKIVQLGSPHRLKTIYRVNSSVAYNANRYKSQLANYESRPYWLYVQLDRPTKRKSHEPFHNKVFMYNDPIWDIIYPPNGWYCMCSVRALTHSELEAMGFVVSRGEDFREFIGEIPEEWRYNPGKNSFEPDLTKYDLDLLAIYNALKNPSPREG